MREISYSQNGEYQIPDISLEAVSYTHLPGRVEIQKEETKADDESGKNETEEENNY